MWQNSWIHFWYFNLMLKYGYIICFQISNLTRTQILITRSSYPQLFFNKCSSDTRSNHKHILQNSSFDGCFNVQRMAKHSKLTITFFSPNKTSVGIYSVIVHYKLRVQSIKYSCLTIFSRF